MTERGETSIALIAALHHDDYEGAGAVVSALSWDQLVVVVTHLASMLESEWALQCGQLGVDWDEFISEAGLALARAEES